jgi:hypothetical protein
VTLADEQAALVAALVAGGAPPPGFDATRLDAARDALLRKRAGEVAAAWPVLAASLGPQWTATFTGWARGRPPGGALRDGWDLARELATAGRLPAGAAGELRARERVRRVWRPGWGGYPRVIERGARPREAAVQLGGVGAVIVVIWLLIGVLAAGQRGYLGGSQDNCAKAGTTVVTIITGPLNYAGVNPKVNCQVPQPSQ